MPPLFGIAVKVTLVPAQMVLPAASDVMLTDGVTWALTVKAAEAPVPVLPTNAGLVEPIDIL